MILGVFLALCAAGALLGGVFRPAERLGQALGVIFLAAAGAAAVALTQSEPVTLGDVQLSVTSYAAAFLTVAVASCLLLCLVGATTQPPAELAPAALAAFGGFGVALTSADPRVSLMAGAAAAATGSVTLLHHPGGEARDGRLAEIRILGVVIAALLLAAIVLLRPPWNGHEERAIGVGFLALTLAVAVRSGAVPFHVPAAHLSRNAAPAGAALLLVWIPAGIGMLALTWSPIAFRVDTDWMSAGIGLVQAVAVATILLGGLAALVHDRADEVAAYSIVSDAGFILLALAARTESAAEPARLWLLVFVAAKSALVAWVEAATRASGSAELAQMRGWLRRTPVLGLCLLAIATATLGWPDSPVAGARSNLVRLGLPGSLGWVGGAAVVLSIGYYARLLLIGALRSTEPSRAAWSERPRLGFALRKPRVAAAPEATAPTLPMAPAATPEPSVATAATDGEAPAAPVELPKPKRSRRTKSAASAEPLPTIAAAVPGEQAAPEPDSERPVEQPAKAAPASTTTPAASTAEPAAPEPKELVLHRPRAPRTSLRHRLALIWRLNRTLEVSLVVLAAAGLSMLVASGSLGARNAAGYGIPLGTAAHATSSPTPVPSPPPTQAPLPSGTPFVTAPPSGSAAPTGSLNPGQSPTPAKTSIPTPIIQ